MTPLVKHNLDQSHIKDLLLRTIIGINLRDDITLENVIL